MWPEACHIWRILHYKVLQEVWHFYIQWQALAPLRKWHNTVIALTAKTVKLTVWLHNRIKCSIIFIFNGEQSDNWVSGFSWIPHENF